ncbi:16S rRNA (guanine(527)-N(7))-methyltransferase RsmG [Flavobacteriaceae bacterium]|nr:16S rRNA (guanine(527)-N(7))-methyltransferase RsmG [Flavobacteriaceae bacterium]
MNKLLKHFPDLNTKQKEQFAQLDDLYTFWNAQINVISRKDMDAFYERHVLHALGIAKILQFKEQARVLDVGTGGGFPGIPLAILFPKTQFYLIDSIGKKIKVVHAVQESLGLTNVKTSQLRAEDFKEKVDFVVSRAVKKMEVFVPWVKNNLNAKHKHSLKNGILYLKGGDLTEELKSFPKAQSYNLKDHFDTPFFETKKVVHLSL